MVEQAQFIILDLQCKRKEKPEN